MSMVSVQIGLYSFPVSVCGKSSNLRSSCYEICPNAELVANWNLDVENSIETTNLVGQLFKLLDK